MREQIKISERITRKMEIGQPEAEKVRAEENVEVAKGAQKYYLRGGLMRGFLGDGEVRASCKDKQKINQ